MRIDHSESEQMRLEIAFDLMMHIEGTVRSIISGKPRTELTEDDWHNLIIIMNDYARGFELTGSKSSPNHERTLSGKIEELDRHIQELGANIVYLSEVIKVADRECLF